MAIIEKPGETHNPATPSAEVAQAVSLPAAEVGLAVRVAGVTFILAALTLLAKAIGFLRQVVIAGAYGAGPDLDAFFLAVSVPDMVATLALFVSLNLFLPMYTAERARSLESASAFAAAFLSWASGILFGLSLFLLAAADAMVGFLAPELNPGLQGTAAASLRILAFMVLFRGLEGSLRGILHTHRRFVLPGIAALLFGVLSIVAVVGWKEQAGVLALAWGTLLGIMIPLLILVPLAWNVVRKDGGFRPKAHPLLREVTRLLPWVLIIEAASLVLPIIDRYMAARWLPAGRISALAYGRLLAEVPFDLVGITLATTLFPEFAALQARGDLAGFRRVLRRGIRAVVAVSLPITALLVVLREPVIRAIYQRGAFDAEATLLTAQALWGFAVGLPVLCAVILVTQAAYAAHRFRRILGVKLFALAVKIGVTIALIPVMGHAGIALGTSIFFAVFLVGLLPAVTDEWRRLVPSPWVLLAATAVATAIGWGLTTVAEAAGVSEGIPLLAALIGIWIVSGLVYFLICRAGRVEEILWVERLIVQRVLGREGKP